jgi:hypothetical protein
MMAVAVVARDDVFRAWRVSRTKHQQPSKPRFVEGETVPPARSGRERGMTYRKVDRLYGEWLSSRCRGLSDKRTTEDGTQTFSRCRVALVAKQKLGRQPLTGEVNNEVGGGKRGTGLGPGRDLLQVRSRQVPLQPNVASRVLSDSLLGRANRPHDFTGGILFYFILLSDPTEQGTHLSQQAINPQRH